MKYFTENDSAVARVIKDGISIETLINKFEQWVDHYMAINKLGAGRVRANLIRALNAAMTKLPSPLWQTKLLKLLEDRHPQLFIEEK